jgi:hypothetical protein
MQVDDDFMAGQLQAGRLKLVEALSGESHWRSEFDLVEAPIRSAPATAGP